MSGTSVGFSIFLICSIDFSSGESPPCIHKILSSIKAATGRQLKQSMNIFQSLMLYLLLPVFKFKNYIRRKSHRFGWLRSIRGCLGEGKNSWGTWFCKPWVDRLFRVRIFLDRRSLPKRGSSTLAGIFRGQRASANRDTVRGYRLNYLNRTANFKRRLQFQEDGLLHEDFFASHTQSLDLIFEEIDLLGDFGIFDWKQFIDDVVNVDVDFSFHGWLVMNCSFNQNDLSIQKNWKYQWLNHQSMQYFT